MGTVTSGLNTFDTKISVEAGDRFGVLGSSIGTLYCNTEDPGDLMGIAEGGIPAGGTATFKEKTGAQAAVSAVIEPDADRDGYGDETQDKCPQSALCRPLARSLLLDAISQAPLEGRGEDPRRIQHGLGDDRFRGSQAPAKSKKARVSAQAKLAPISSSSPRAKSPSTRWCSRNR